MSKTSASVQYKNHPAADLFPMMPESELIELAEDIKKNGLLDPIVLHEQMVLDGRNRLAACDLADIEPRFTEWSGGSPTLYVLSKNLHRRQLTTSQKAAIAVESLPLLKEETRLRQIGSLRKGQESPVGSTSNQREEGGRSREIAATQAGIGVATIWEAEQVKKEAPDEFEKIKRGETSVHTAYRKVKGVDPPSKDKLPATQRAKQIADLAAQGYRKSQIADEIGIGVERITVIARESGIEIPADDMRQGRKIDVNRIVGETVLGAQALTAGLDLIYERLHQIHNSKTKEWADSLQQSLSALNRLLRQLRRMSA